MPTQTINLNNTTPAAPAGAQNVEWQADPPSLDPAVSRNVSANVPIATGSDFGLVRPDGATIAIAEGVLSVIPAGVPMVIGFVIGSGSPGTNVGPLLLAPRAGTLSKCLLAVKSSDSSLALQFRVRQNGTDLFSSDPVVEPATAEGSVFSFSGLVGSPVTVNPGDLFSIDIISGSSNWSFTAQMET